MTNPAPTRPLEDGAVVPQLYARLRDRIISCELHPGRRVSESEFATEYQVSRQPVREAFIKLSAEKLVVVRPQSGTFVCRISTQKVLNTQFVREAVEADIIRLVTERATPRDMASLDILIDLQDIAAQADDPTEFVRLDQAFHRELAQIAQRPDICDFLQSVNTEMNRVRNISARQFSAAKLVRQHKNIVDAIRRGDSAQAEQQMRAHLREILTDLPRIAQANPDFFQTPKSPNHDQR